MKNSSLTSAVSVLSLAVAFGAGSYVQSFDAQAYTSDLTASVVQGTSVSVCRGNKDMTVPVSNMHKYVQSGDVIGKCASTSVRQDIWYRSAPAGVNITMDADSEKDMSARFVTSADSATAWDYLKDSEKDMSNKDARYYDFSNKDASAKDARVAVDGPWKEEIWYGRSAPTGVNIMMDSEKDMSARFVTPATSATAWDYLKDSEKDMSNKDARVSYYDYSNKDASAKDARVAVPGPFDERIWYRSAPTEVNITMDSAKDARVAADGKPWKEEIWIGRSAPSYGNVVIDSSAKDARVAVDDNFVTDIWTGRSAPQAPTMTEAEARAELFRMLFSQ